MSDKDNKSIWSDVLTWVIGLYFLVFVISLIVFTEIGNGHVDDPRSEAFLKAIVWPYSIIEWNIKN